MSETAESAEGGPLLLYLHSYGVHGSSDPNTRDFGRTAAELGFDVVAPQLTDLIPGAGEAPMLVIPPLSEQAARARRAIGQLWESEQAAWPADDGPVPMPREPAVVLADSQGLLVHRMVGRTNPGEQLIALAPPLYGSVLQRILEPLDRRVGSGSRYQLAAEPYGGAFGITRVPGVCDVVVSTDYVEEIAAMEGAVRLQVPAPEKGELWPIAAHVAIILQEYDSSRIAPVVMLPNPDNRLDTEGQLAALAVLDELIPNLSAQRVDDAGGHRFMNAHGRAAIRYALASARAKVSDAVTMPRASSERPAVVLLQD